MRKLEFAVRDIRLRRPRAAATHPAGDGRAGRDFHAGGVGIPRLGCARGRSRAGGRRKAHRRHRWLAAARGVAMKRNRDDWWVLLVQRRGQTLFVEINLKPLKS